MGKPAVSDDQTIVRALKALADAKRFQMLREIALSGELSCGEVGRRFPLSQPTISHHLKILAEAGLLAVREKGQHHFISVNQELIREILVRLNSRLLKSSGMPKARRVRQA